MYELLSLCEKVKSTNNMFNNCKQLTELDLNNFDTSNSTDMQQMFYFCEKLAKLNINFDTSNVTTMYNMFYRCRCLTELDVTSFNTEKVTSMRSMFRQCSGLTTINVSNFNTSSVTTMYDMFSECSKLQKLDIRNFDMKNVTNIGNMFYQCSNLTEIQFGEFDTRNVTSMEYLFFGTKITTVPELNCCNCKDIRVAFSACSSLISLGGLKDLGKAYTQKTNNYNYYELNLSPCINLTYQSLMNVINGLYDLNLTYDVANGGTLYTQSLSLGATNMAKLTAEEIAIATNKGWTIS